jgi:hypothetical protein
MRKIAIIKIRNDWRFKVSVVDYQTKMLLHDR